jgi:hypothetical protein
MEFKIFCTLDYQDYMTMESKEITLNRVRSYVLQILPGSEIILFGSGAGNEANEHSD